MPFARHRLDLIVVPSDRHRAVDADAFAALLARWREQGRVARLVEGGVADVRLDVPGAPTLYANQLGGFKVSCAHCHAPLARAFGAAVQGWRGGGDFALDCPSCGRTQSLDEVVLNPAGAFARGAVVFVEVEGIRLADGVLEELEAVLGPDPRVVLRRPV